MEFAILNRELLQKETINGIDYIEINSLVIQLKADGVWEDIDHDTKVWLGHLDEEEEKDE